MDFREITTKELGYDDEIKSKVGFYQQDAGNIDIKKCGGFGLVLAINLIDRMKYPKAFLSMAHKLLNSNGLLMIASPYAWNT